MTTPAPTSPTAPALKLWFEAYRVEVILFAVSFFALAMFSGQRFLRQSEAPQFVYQAKSWLEGRGDVDAQVLPNLEDWACVRESGATKTRCEGQALPTDKWYSSFPWFPAVVMLPFVMVHGYQFNDTSFGVIIGALAIALFYSLLRTLRENAGENHSVMENAALALLLGFGTLFFYCAIRGEVWFSAEVMGVALTCLYVRNAAGARRPALAGLFWSMAVMTRTPLFFTGIFFVLEALAPEKTNRLEQLKNFMKADKAKQALGRFVMGAAPLGSLAAIYNFSRYGSFTEFGHRYFFNNRVNADIDTFGLFNPHYLLRNLDAAFLLLPVQDNGRLAYSPWGLSLFVTLPMLVLAFVPATELKRAYAAVAGLVGVLLLSAAMPEEQGSFPVGFRSPVLWLALAGAIGFLAWSAWKWATAADAPRIVAPLLITLVACALPGLFYQNTGYAQFGFRFSLDYTPYIFLLIAYAGWSFRKTFPLVLAALAIIVGVWGAVGFRGYTELVRRW